MGCARKVNEGSGFDFTSLRCRLVLGEVIGEDVEHGQADVSDEELTLDDSTAGATLDREGEEKLDDFQRPNPS